MEAPTPEARHIPEPPGVQDHQVQQLGLLLKYETETTLLFDTVQISTVLSGTKSSMLILALYSNYITGFSAGCYFKYSLLYFCGVIQNTINR